MVLLSMLLYLPLAFRNLVQMPAKAVDFGNALYRSCGRRMLKTKNGLLWLAPVGT